MNEDESIFISRCVVVLKKKNKSTRLNTSKDEARTSKEEARAKPNLSTKHRLKP